MSYEYRDLKTLHQQLSRGLSSYTGSVEKVDFHRQETTVDGQTVEIVVEAGSHQSASVSTVDEPYDYHELKGLYRAFVDAISAYTGERLPTMGAYTYTGTGAPVTVEVRRPRTETETANQTLTGDERGDA